MSLDALGADDVIRLLGLEPHPEGGYFRETFRDPTNADGARPASTAIYFLLRAGETSRWHRIDAAEVWHWYAGAPLELSIIPPGGRASKLRLGPRLNRGERPQAIVAQGHWQQAESLGEWSLTGCTVAPGFTFDGFELAPDNFAPTN